MLSAKEGLFANVGNNLCRLGTEVEDKVKDEVQGKDEVKGKDEDKDKVEDEGEDKDEVEDEGEDEEGTEDLVFSCGLLLVMVDRPKSSTTLCSSKPRVP